MDEATLLEDGDVEELIDDLEELQETADTHHERRILRSTVGALNRLAHRPIFGVDDVVQQIIGGIILSAPFVVTEEVWNLAASMNWIQWAVTVFMVIVIGYGALYEADDDRDFERERSIGGVPVRLLSLILVSYLSVTLLAFVFDAPETFEATRTTTLKAISIGAIFSVVGAATADSLF